jgi:hypothetical protein
MSKKKKATGGNPAKQAKTLELKASQHPLAKRLFRRIEEGTLLVRDLQPHLTPMAEADTQITMEQWRFLRGSVVNDLALYAHLTGQESPIEMIIQAEQERVLIEQEPPV